jgi:ABC-type uncharacterized transport system auxiliary subunit
MRSRAVIVALGLGLAACSGSVPMTRYYQLALPPGGPPERQVAGSVLAIEPLASEGAYDDERIVYRVDPVRLDYYQYHRWSTAPGSMIGNYLQQALARSGRFRSVVRDTTPDTAAVLGGRVTAIEEVDDAQSRWNGHVALELTLTDPRTGEILWSQAYEQREPLDSRTPAGLARALGVAMQRIAREAAPVIAALADRQARARGLAPAPVGSP